MGFGATVHLPAFAAHRNVEVVALADNGSGRAEALISKNDHKLLAFSNGLSLIDWGGIDIVSIAAPPIEQEKLVRAALINGKHVLCEKPFCLSANVADELACLAQDRRLLGALFYEFRYDPGIKRLIELVNSEEIGKVQHLDVTWQTSGALDLQRAWSWRNDSKQGGGVLIDWFIHVADYASLIAQSPVRNVRARAGTVITQERIDRNMVIRSVSAPDECEVVCEFESGVTGVFAVSNACLAPVGHKIKVTGDRGSIVYHHPPPFSSNGRIVRLVREYGEEIMVDLDLTNFWPSSDQRVAAASDLIADLLATLEGESRSLLPSFRDGAKNWGVIEAAISAVADGCQHQVR